MTLETRAQLVELGLRIRWCGSNAGRVWHGYLGQVLVASVWKSPIMKNPPRVLRVQVRFIQTDAWSEPTVLAEGTDFQAAKGRVVELLVQAGWSDA